MLETSSVENMNRDIDAMFDRITKAADAREAPCLTKGARFSLAGLNVSIGFWLVGVCLWAFMT